MTAKKSKSLIEWFILTGLILAAILIGLFFPHYRSAMVQSSWSLGKEMLMILPAVLVMMGLFTVWISKETVVKYLGKTSGMKGILLALLFGATPTGPLYVAFPLAAALREKGAGLTNIVVFLTAWACIKLPQEMVEMQFLGVDFMLVRMILTIIASIIMGLTIEKMFTNRINLFSREVN